MSKPCDHKWDIVLKSHEQICSLCHVPRFKPKAPDLLTELISWARAGRMTNKGLMYKGNLHSSIREQYTGHYEEDRILMKKLLDYKRKHKL